MSGKYTEAQKKASLKYQEKLSRIYIRASNEEIAEIKEYAVAHHISVRQLVLQAVKEKMIRDP